VRREVQSLDGGLIQRRGQLQLRLRQRSAAGGLERDVAAEDSGERREQLEFRQIEIARGNRIVELVRLEVHLRLAGDCSRGRDDGDLRRLERSLRELNVRRGGRHRLAVDRAVAQGGGAGASKLLLPAGRITR